MIPIGQLTQFGRAGEAAATALSAGPKPRAQAAINQTEPSN
jgi:hypothetical protein